MPFVLALLALALAFGVLVAMAAILGTAVPALLIDPGNLWAWIGVIFVAGLLLASGRVGK